jgi:hypothetical protein
MVAMCGQRNMTLLARTPCVAMGVTEQVQDKCGRIGSGSNSSIGSQQHDSTKT